MSWSEPPCRAVVVVLGLAVLLLGGAPALRLGSFSLAAAAAPDTAALDGAFARFWAAPDANAAAKAARDIVGTGVSFDEALARLKRGRPYGQPVPRGLRRLTHRTSDGLEHNYAIVVPETYDASRAHQVRVQLHGGIARPSGEAGREGIDRIPGTASEISVFPTGWIKAMWWYANQAENLLGILDELKRTYNVDENRVYLTGISDGGTGVYFMGFRETTPWASFLPLIGHMMVLAHPDTQADGDMYPGNLVNKPFFIVNAGRDRLYPTAIVEPYIEHLRKIGVEVVYHPQPDSEHNTNWWGSERDHFETFVRAHPRDPLPDRLAWETERTDRYNRAHWLVIDNLGAVDGEATLRDTNQMDVDSQLDFGIRLNNRLAIGTRLAEVLDGSNAAAFGLRAGDVIIEIDGHAMASSSDIVEMLETRRIGVPVAFLVDRGGRRGTLRATFSPDQVSGAPDGIFPRRKPSGRVDLVRSGNTVEASTRGVKAFTLLLSPDEFDFGRPVKVVTNGRVAFEGKVEKNVTTLLKWAAHDNDRTMLFGAELRIEVGKKN